MRVSLKDVAEPAECASTLSGSLEAFRDRVMARLVLVPPHDPQFRRNRERVVRDAERENILLEWDLGYPEDDQRS